MERKKETGLTEGALVYSHALSPRLQYIVDFLSGYYELPFSLTADEEAYLASPALCKINYSYHKLTEDELWIHPHALLFQSNIHSISINVTEREGMLIFFSGEGNLGFDLFAAIFFLISRYEEYLPFHPDSYGRFPHTESMAFKNGFLDRPIVNIWLEVLRKELVLRNEAFGKQPAFQVFPTYDIDMAWSYRHKGFSRNCGGLLRELVTGKWKAAGQRLAVLRKKQNDPFGAYDWMDTLHHEAAVSPLYFFLVAGHRGRLDKNIDTGNNEFAQLIRDHASKYAIGLHPSWASGDDKRLLKSEKHYLETQTGRKIDASRQHFIRFRLPETYRELLAVGIHNDYSMGYGSINGFRASITSSYYWYDLAKDEATLLKLHPFCFMDANAYYEQGLDARAALKEMQYYFDEVSKVGGRMVMVWHNSFLGTDPSFSEWREVYREFVLKARGTNL